MKSYASGCPFDWHPSVVVSLCHYAHQGLSAEALAGIIRICGVTAAGSMTNKLRVEKILQHLQYDEEAIKEILARFPKKEKVKCYMQSRAERLLCLFLLGNLVLNITSV